MVAMKKIFAQSNKVQQNKTTQNYKCGILFLLRTHMQSLIHRLFLLDG